MLKDIKLLTELYLHSNGLLPEGKSWNDFHDELIQNVPKKSTGLLADVNPKGKCKYALFVDVNTKNKSCKVKYKDYENYVGIDKVDDWSSHLFWQGSGQRQSKESRSSPHDYFKKGKFSIDELIKPLQVISDSYCYVYTDKGKNKTRTETGPLFWSKDKKEESTWLKNIIAVLNKNKNEIDKQVKDKVSSLESNADIFIGIIVDDKTIGDYELFRRYLLFVRMRAGIDGGLKYFANRDTRLEIKNFIGTCPSCFREKPLLKLWHVPAELSFYQLEKKSYSSFEYSEVASFSLCQGCADLLFIFKQRILETLTRKLGGNECLVLPSIKLLPLDQSEKRRLYENLKRFWGSSDKKDAASTEERLLYRLGQLPSYATVTFIFGDYITVGETKDVKRLDRLNIIFPDVLPSRLSQIANAMQEANKQLDEMWSLRGRDRNCPWNIQDDFYLLYQLFYPPWEEKKKDKSRRRSETERYLRAIFYGQEISCSEIAEDCYGNLVSAIKTSRNATDEDRKARYAKDNYIGNLLSLFVFLEQIGKINKSKDEVEIMGETEKVRFSFTAMPDLGEFVERHPLFKDEQYLAPFFVGCLFSYVEYLQKDSSRLAAYNWLGTMALTYGDILEDIYPKILNYIKNKEKIISSPRLQELTKAIAYYDCGRCDNDRVALIAFCHGWAVGQSFILKKDVVKAINKKLKELGMQITDEIKECLNGNKEKLNVKDTSALEGFLSLIPEEQREKISTVWQKSDKEIANEKGGKDNEEE